MFFRRSRLPPPLYRQLTFRRGSIRSARFAPDGQTILYSAAWQGSPVDVFTARPEAPEARSMGLSRTQLVSVSSTSEMAVLLNSKAIGTWVNMGTLARAPLVGRRAARSAGARAMGRLVARTETIWPWCAISAAATAWNIPSAKPLYETGGWIGHPRVSPKGDSSLSSTIRCKATTAARSRSSIMQGNKKTLSGEWFTIQGVAWSPDGKEIWFTASKSGVDRTLYATTLDGKERMVLRLPGALMLLRHLQRRARAADARQLAPRTGRHDRRRCQAARSLLAGLHLSRGYFRRTARLCSSMKRAAAARSIIPSPAG